MVLAETVAPSLRRAAKKRYLPILEVESAEQALQHVCSRRPNGRPAVIIVQIGRLLDESLKFIRLVTTSTVNAPVIAAATRHTLQTEREVLCAGATYYIPGVAPGQLDSLLAAIGVAVERS